MSTNFMFDESTGELQDNPTTLPAHPYWKTHRVRTMFNHEQIPQLNEFNSQPSQTVQDQNLSLRELVERSMRGLPIYGNMPIDFGAVHMPNLAMMDLSERAEFQEILNEQVKTLRAKVEAQKLEQSIQLTPINPLTETSISQSSNPEQL